jgi:serine protease AprX
MPRTVAPPTVAESTSTRRVFAKRPAPALLRRSVALILVAALCGLAPATVRAQGLLSLVDRPLQQLGGGLGLGSVRVIVRAERGALGSILRIVLLLGGKLVATHGFIDGVTLTIPAISLNLLVRVPGVLSISLDSPVVGGPLVDGPGAESHLAATLGLDEHSLVGQGIDGRGVGVAVIDSGLAQTGTYEIRRFVDFTQSSRGLTYNDRAQPSDEYGHGTHVGGLIAGNGAGSNGRYRGVAPGVSLIGLKVLDRNGAGYTSDVLEALEYAIANRQALNLRAINMSLGHPIFEAADRDPLVLGVEAAARAGIVVVVSAGNFGCLPNTNRCGYAGITSPGNAPSALTVGAIDTRDSTSRLDDEVTSYSSRGPSWYNAYAKPDVVAPGHRLVSAMAPQSTLGRDPKRVVQPVTPWLTYARLSGTSMATAVTTGAVALVLGANERGRNTRQRLTPNTVKAILEFSSFNVNGADELTQGAGALNAAGAMELARRIDPSAPAGQGWLNGPVTPSTKIGDDVLPWSQRIIWGDRVAQGDAIYSNVPAWSQTIVWGDTVVWGDTIVWGETMIWGDTLVWADSIIWADTIVWGDHTYNAQSRSWANLAQ